MPGDQHRSKMRRRPHQQQLQLAQRLRRAQLVHVVDHQPHLIGQRLQARQQPLDDRPAIQVRRRGQRPHQRRTGRGLPQRIEHRDPESLRIMLLPRHRHPRGALLQARRTDPRPQQERLPAPGRRRHLGNAPGPAEPLEQRRAGYDPAPDHRSGCTGGNGCTDTGTTDQGVTAGSALISAAGVYPAQRSDGRLGGQQVQERRSGISGRVSVWAHKHRFEPSISRAAYRSIGRWSQTHRLA